MRRRFLAGIAGCLWAVGTLLVTPGCGTVPPPPRLDPVQQAAQLLAADKAFARMSLEKGPLAAFATYTTEGSIQLPPAGPPVRGRVAIAQAAAGPPGTTMHWTPEFADVARSGDLGWTWGGYIFSVPGPNGIPMVSTGRYLNVWRRMPDGSWKVIADIGNVVPPAPRP